MPCFNLEMGSHLDGLHDSSAPQFTSLPLKLEGVEGMQVFRWKELVSLRKTSRSKRRNVQRHIKAFGYLIVLAILSWTFNSIGNTLFC